MLRFSGKMIGLKVKVKKMRRKVGRRGGGRGGVSEVWGWGGFELALGVLVVFGAQ